MASLFAKGDFDPRIDNIFDPSKVPGSSVYLASNGTDLGMQAIFAGSFFLLFVLLFSALRLRWPFIFSPRTRLTITAPPYLSRRFFGWILATMRTPEAYILNTLGLDTVIFLRFYKMCMRLLLDVAFFSILIIWPINIYWSKTNLDADARAPAAAGDTSGGGGLLIPVSYSVTDYLFNLTLNTSDPRQQWYLVPHIVFVHIFSGLAYYHISKFSSRWASLRWHFLMQSRHALVSRTVMLTGVPRHLAKNPRELEWFWSSGLQLGKIERVRVCRFNTRLTSAAKERARCLIRLEHAYMKLLGNPCAHPDYDPEQLRALAMDASKAARAEEQRLLALWAKPSRLRRPRHGAQRAMTEEEALQSSGAQNDSALSCEKMLLETVVHIADAAAGDGAASADATAAPVPASRPTVWVRPQAVRPWSWKRVDAIDYWREKFLAADCEFHRLRDSIVRGDDHGHSTTAFVTFEDAATAHIATQLSCYPNPGYMKARLAPEPRGVYWPNVWISSQRKWAGLTIKWACIFVIWAFWSVPVILFSSLLTPASLGKLFPEILSSKHNLLRAFLSTTVPSVFLLLFLNMLPWILKQVHFFTGVRTKPDIDYSVMTKMWAFLIFNVVLVFGFSGTFWSLVVDAVNRPGTIMQSLASNIPRVGTFFTGYILVLGVGYQPFKLLQLRPVIWHICRQWLCSTPRDYARLVSPVYIDWYSVYPYPLLVFAIAMVYSTFSPPVVVGAVIYYAIGYPVMKYLLLYVYFHPFETAGMAWPKVCRRMIFSIILYQVVMLTFVVVKGGGWYTFSLVPVIVVYIWFFYFLGWSLEKQGTVLPVYLWRNPPPNSSYPPPPYAEVDEAGDGVTHPHPHMAKAPIPAQQGQGTHSFSLSPGQDNAPRERPETVPGRHVPGRAPHAQGAMHPFGADPEPSDRRPKRSTLPSWFGNAAACSSTPQTHGVSRLLQPSEQLASSPTVPLASKSRPRQAGAQRRPGHRRQESSRGARTREIILAGNAARLVSPGAGSTWHRRAKGRTSPRRYQVAPHAANPSRAAHVPSRPLSLQQHRSSLHAQRYGHVSDGSAKMVPRSGLSSESAQQRDCRGVGARDGDTSPPLQQQPPGSTAGPNSGGTYRVSKRRYYKCLAEAATVEGTRLLVSLGKLPSELYSRHTDGRHRRSPPALDGALAPADHKKRWSFSGRLHIPGTVASRQPGREARCGRPDSAAGCESPPQPGRQPESSAGSAAEIQGVDDEWTDSDSSDGAGHTSISPRRRGKMAMLHKHGRAVERAACCSDRGCLEEWDPLMYLKPAASGEHQGGRAVRVEQASHAGDKTLGTLLTSLDCQPSRASSTGRVAACTSQTSSDAQSGLRCRRQVHSGHHPDHGSQAAASIIDAEGAQGYDAQHGPRRGIAARMRQTLQRMRDYFLAEFRPAAPILDLTYDRLYSQGIEEGAHAAHAGTASELLEDDGDTILPFRQLFGRVLPRSMSRMFGPEPEATAALHSVPAAATAPPGSRVLSSPRSVSPVLSSYLMAQARATTHSTLSGAGARRGALWRRGRSSHDVGQAQQHTLATASSPPPQTLDAHGKHSEWEYVVDSLGELPQPPRAPWLAEDTTTTPPLLANSRASSQPALARLGSCRSSSASNASLPPLDGRLLNRSSCHKNSLPPPRAPLTARMVSELNYVARRSTTPVCMPASISQDRLLLQTADEPDVEQLLVANYQRFAVERQSTFEPDEYTDYHQTPMLNFRGILDRGIQDYVHPGLTGEPPTLWLPVKDTPGGDGDSGARCSSSDISISATPCLLARPGDGDCMMSTAAGMADQPALSESFRRIAEHLRQHTGGPIGCTDSIAAVIAAVAAAGTNDQLAAAGFSAGPETGASPADGRAEVVDICVHHAGAAGAVFPKQHSSQTPGD